MKKHTTTQSLVADEKIIDMYWERNPDAIQETDKKYGPLLKNVAHNILCDPLDCEECQNDTYFKISNTIPSTKPTAFPAFIIRIMRQISIDRYRKNQAKNGFLPN